MFAENAARQEDHTMEPIRFASLETRATRFRSKKQWIESHKDMQLRCWNCCLQFSNTPCFIPRQIRNTSTGKEYDTLGVFCGFACAYTFLKNRAEFVKDRSFFDKLSMLKMLFTLFSNKRVCEFKEAPCLYDMVHYGGHVKEEDYKKALYKVNAAILADAKHIHT